MEKVMVFGTFDVLHPGHLSYFRQARKFGDFLIVVVARDKNVLRLKDKKPRNDERRRLKKVRGLVDKAVLGYVFDMFKVIKREKPAAVCFGYDQKVDKEVLRKIKKAKIKIKRAKAYKPKKYKSSLLK